MRVRLNGKLLFLLVIFGLVIAEKVSTVFAVELQYSLDNPEIAADPFSLNVSILGAADGRNYMRIDLFQEGTTRYFGETFNGSGWYGGSEGRQYYPVEIRSGSGSAVLQGRLGNFTASEYGGPGNYKLRLRRYTESGNAASDRQEPLDVVIKYALPSPSPSPTPEIKATPPKETVRVSASKITPAVSPTVSSASPGGAYKSVRVSVFTSLTTDPVMEAAVLGTGTSVSGSLSKQSVSRPGVILSAGGLLLCISSLLLFIEKRKSIS